MKLLKNKTFRVLAIILALFGILYYRFGSDLFVGILVIIGGFLLFLLIGFLNTEEGQTLIGMLIGGAVIIAILYFLFGKFLIPIGILALLAFIVPTIKKVINEKNIKSQKLKTIEDVHKALEELSRNGYFRKIFTKRLSAFEAVPEAITSTDISLPEESKEMWLTLDQQYKFFTDNAEKMSRFNLSNLNYSFIFRRKSNILRDERSSIFPFTWPIKKILEEYNFDINSNVSSVIDNLNTYNDFYSKESSNFFSNLGIIKSGVEGEERVNEELSIFKDIIINLPNIRLELEGTTVESDNILITEKGIFSVEVKNFGESGNYSLRIAKDGQWLKEFENGRVEPMKNIA